MTQAEAIETTFNKLEAMPQEQFEREVEKCRDDPLTRMLMYAENPNCFDEL